MTLSTQKNSAAQQNLQRAAWVACIVGVSVQASFLFTSGTIEQTILSVVLLAGASFLWIWQAAGLRQAVLTSAGVMAIGYLAEAIGVATGFPFGEYAYSGGLGYSLLSVSLIVPVAWLMLAYPAWRVAKILVKGGSVKTRGLRIAVGAWALTAWDVFLDPQMVDAGNWGWANPEPSLIGVPGIPLTNYAGWLLVSALIMLFLEYRATTSRTVETTIARVPVAIYLWTYLGSIVANLTFWDRPMVALVGGVLMGTIAFPLCIRLYSIYR